MYKNNILEEGFFQKLVDFFKNAEPGIRKHYSKKKKNHKIKDECPVCDKDLYYNGEISKRVGLLDEDDEVIGWLCPFCKTEFDFNEKNQSEREDSSDKRD